MPVPKATLTLLLLPLGLILQTSCSGKDSGSSQNACERFVDAENACKQDAGDPAPPTEYSDICLGYNRTDEKTDYFTCMAEAYETADCTSDLGYSDAQSAVMLCS